MTQTIMVIQQFIIFNMNLKPSDGFLNYCNNNNILIINEIIKLTTFYRLNNIDAKEKIKKTFKNKYYLIHNKSQNKI